MPPFRIVDSAVSQEELRVLIGLRNQIRHLTRLYRRQSGDALLRLLGGASVEPGEYYAEVEERCTGASRVNRLVLY
jgi:hypothetical protein